MSAVDGLAAGRRAAPEPDILAVLIESVASRQPTDIWGLAAILASEENRAVIVKALRAAAEDAS